MKPIRDIDRLISAIMNEDAKTAKKILKEWMEDGFTIDFVCPVEVAP